MPPRPLGGTGLWFKKSEWFKTKNAKIELSDCFKKNCGSAYRFRFLPALLVGPVSMMKKTFQFLSLIVVVMVSACSGGGVPPVVTETIEAIRQDFAPDKRVALFSVEPHYRNGRLVLTGETNLPEARDQLLARLSERAIEAVDSIALLPDAGLAGKIFGIVNLSACNIRSLPRHSAELSTQATLGTPLRVYKEQDGWFLVQTPDGYLGWLDPGGFTAMDDEAYQAWMNAAKVVYLPDFGFAWDAPREDAGIVGDLLAGNILGYSGEQGGYVELFYPDGRRAFLPAATVADYAEWLDSREPNPTNILAEARRFMGRPYLWGGTSGKGVDCSGFTKMVFFLNGVLLPRDASQQVHTGTEVTTDTTLAGLLPGDLLFFGQRATAEKKERITHVALYLGDGRVIHASGKVCVQSLRRDDPDFAEDRLLTFVRAKRILDSPGQNGTVLLEDSPFYRLEGEMRD